MTTLVSLIVSTAVAWGLHALLGGHVSSGVDFALGTLAGGAAYVATFYWLKKVRGGF